MNYLCSICVPREWPLAKNPLFPVQMLHPLLKILLAAIPPSLYENSKISEYNTQTYSS